MFYRMGLVLLLLCLPRPWAVGAVVRNVGSGQTHTTIQSGVTAAGAGDEVRIHGGTYDECVNTGGAGTQTNPIVITAASGQNPVWRATCNQGAVEGALQISHSDWRVDGTLNGGTLTFDGINGNTPLWAIYHYAASGDINRTQIKNITIRNWATNDSYVDGSGMGGIFLRANANRNNRNVLIKGVTIHDTVFGMLLHSASDLVVEDNEIHTVECGDHGNNEISSWAIKYGLGPNSGTNQMNNLLIRRNDIHGVPSCTLNSSCIYCDVGGQGAVIEYNYCHDSNEGNADIGFKGIFVEANCKAHIVRHNVVANTGGYGLQTRDSADPPLAGNASKFYRNTVFDAASGSMYLRDGSTPPERCDETGTPENCGAGACVYMEGNLFYQTRTAADYIRAYCPARVARTEEWDSNRNWYFNSTNNTQPFQFEENPALHMNFTAWKTNCDGCDVNTTHGTDPQFVAITGTVAGDLFNLNTGSAAIDACGNNAELGPHVGNGHDCGAFEAPIFDEAQTTASATTVVVTYETIHGDLTECTASRFSLDASVTGNNRVPTSAVPSGNTVTLTFSTPMSGADVLTLDAERNACRTVFIAGTPMAVGTAAFAGRTVENNIDGGGGDEGVWVSGLSHVVPAGTNRVLAIGCCWSQQAGSPPLALTNFTYGGQACTTVNSALIDDAGSQTLAVAAYCHEADIAAAASSTIAYTASETPSGTRPPICGSGFYLDVNQTTPITDNDTATAANTTTISTPALTTTNPGVAVAVGCANGNVTWSGAGSFTEQLDVCEDASCGKRLLAADLATTGVDVTPAGTTSGSSARLALVGFSFNGGDEGGDPPAGGLALTEHRFHEWTEPASAASAHWKTPANGILLVTPGGKLDLVTRFTATTGVEATSTIKKLLCQDNGGEEYTPGNTFDGHALAFTLTPEFVDGDPIAARMLSNPGAGTFQAGFRHESAAQIGNSLTAINNYSEREWSLQVSNTATLPLTISCSLAHGDGTPLGCTAPACPITILVLPGLASGH